MLEQLGDAAHATPARATALVGAAAMGLQYGVHQRPLSYRALSDALWLLLLLGVAGAAAVWGAGGAGLRFGGPCRGGRKI